MCEQFSETRNNISDNSVKIIDSWASSSSIDVKVIYETSFTKISYCNCGQQPMELPDNDKPCNNTEQSINANNNYYHH